MARQKKKKKRKARKRAYSPSLVDAPPAEKVVVAGTTYVREDALERRAHEIAAQRFGTFFCALVVGIAESGIRQGLLPNTSETHALIEKLRSGIGK